MYSACKIFAADFIHMESELPKHIIATKIGKYNAVKSVSYESFRNKQQADE